MSGNWRSLDTAPEDESVILATSGDWVGEAIMLRDQETNEPVWRWINTGRAIRHVPYGWQPLPASISQPVQSDLRPGGYDGPTGAD